MVELALTIRPAVPPDAEGIARVYLESAEHHAALDPQRYRVPAAGPILVRYREGRQHPPESVGVTLVAELDGEVAGFVDARLDRSPDPMHRDMPFCFIVEIAVAKRRQSQGIGGRLLRAAEDWGRQHGAELAVLEYNSANTRAGTFYQERMGYRIASIVAVKRLE